MKKPSSKLNDLSLGKPTAYISEYAPELLQGVPRSLGRDEIGVSNEQAPAGVDVWHGYELSWLNAKGKPEVALMRCVVPSTTPNIIESKSFKLYLNSLNQTRFASTEQVTVAEGQVSVELLSASDASLLPNTPLPGDCIDSLDIEVSDYELNDSNQPDWASVVIEYSGKAINRESLLRYLISFRQHNEFHEQCVERIFSDISRHCMPESLSVQALYTRRGGLDICPFRSSSFVVAPAFRVNRQ